jgi:hypothetical protein
MTLPQAHYAFVAFDDSTGEILAYGQTATSALDIADKLAPQSPIRIVPAGDIGQTIWAARMNLSSASAALMPTSTANNRLTD